MSEQGSDTDRENERRAGFIMDMRARGVRSRAILAALERIPRARFVAPEFVEFALADRSLPIACGQMIDRPSVAARMVEALDIAPGHKVLEIGTGSGWLAAILSTLAAQVITLERYRSLVRLARQNLAAQSIGNVTVLVRDGLAGEDAHGPYDRILLGGAVEEVPRPLFDQLRPDGAIIAAIGGPQAAQKLTLLRQGHGLPDVTYIGEVRFVPLVSGVAAAN